MFYVMSLWCSYFGHHLTVAFTYVLEIILCSFLDKYLYTSEIAYRLYKLFEDHGFSNQMKPIKAYRNSWSLFGIYQNNCIDDSCMVITFKHEIEFSDCSAHS